jgi:hypothetical protein
MPTEEEYKAEIQHLNKELLRANQDCALLESVRMERDELQRRWNDFVAVRNQPLIDELTALRKIVDSQRQQMRVLSNVYADQPNWIHEWKKKCDENMELQARLKAMEDGSELAQLRRQLLQTESQFEVCKAAYNHRGVLLSNAVMQMELLELEASKRK